VLLELPEEDSHWNHVLWERNVSRKVAEVKSELFEGLSDELVLDLSCVDVVLADLERHHEVRHSFVVHCLALLVEEFTMTVEWVQQVLRSWNKLAGLLLDQAQKLEDFDVVGEELNVARQLEHAGRQLNDWVDQEIQVLTPDLSECEHPQLDAVQELPRIDCFKSLFAHAVPDVSEMQTQLPDVQKANLISLHSVDSEHFNQTILSHSQVRPNVEVATADLAVFGEFVVHFLDDVIE